MKKLTVILLLSVSALKVSSQKVFFVYVQSENEDPFFIKMEGNIYSSSGSGYLILPKLRDTTYSIKLGFSQNKWPEQNFSININHKDHGFILKNLKDKGWGLFDLQSMEILMSSNKTSSEVKNEVKSNKDDSEFSDILAKATGDPSIKESNNRVEENKGQKKDAPPKDTISITANSKSANKEEKEITKKIEQPPATDTTTLVKISEKSKSDPVREEKKDVSKKDTVSVTAIDNDRKELVQKVDEKPSLVDTTKIVKTAEKIEVDPIKEKKNDIPKKEPEKKKIDEVDLGIRYTKSQVTKKSESSTTEGFGLTYIDKYSDGLIDTVRILIPNTKPVVARKDDTPKQEVKFIEITPDTAQQEKKEVSTINKDSSAKTVEPNFGNNCTATATEDDFFELRKKMASVQGDDNMISEARSYFKLKCFSTNQVRNLGSLFLTDEGKYRFFDTAYKFVVDPAGYGYLENELKDQYYINRFKAMLR
ncbi:MAG TPA: hypothetical protein PKC72_09935 [Chitinophagaceae bacterium]|nr:hypothetical protein [Chitinophagaceae bacterium]